MWSAGTASIRVIASELETFILRPSRTAPARDGEIIPEVGGGGLGLGGPEEKGPKGVSKGPKPPIQLLQLLKNSPREAKKGPFCYILVPPGPTQEMELVGPGGEVPGPPGPPVSPAMAPAGVEKSDVPTFRSRTPCNVAVGITKSGTVLRPSDYPSRFPTVFFFTKVKCFFCARFCMMFHKMCEMVL